MRASLFAGALIEGDGVLVPVFVRRAHDSFLDQELQSQLVLGLVEAVAPQLVPDVGVHVPDRQRVRPDERDPASRHEEAIHDDGLHMLQVVLGRHHEMQVMVLFRGGDPLEQFLPGLPMCLEGVRGRLLRLIETGQEVIAFAVL